MLKQEMACKAHGKRETLKMTVIYIYIFLKTMDYKIISGEFKGRATWEMDVLRLRKMHIAMKP